MYFPRHLKKNHAYANLNPWLPRLKSTENSSTKNLSSSLSEALPTSIKEPSKIKTLPDLDPFNVNLSKRFACEEKDNSTSYLDACLNTENGEFVNTNAILSLYDYKTFISELQELHQKNFPSSEEDLVSQTNSLPFSPSEAVTECETSAGQDVSTSQKGEAVDISPTSSYELLSPKEEKNLTSPQVFSSVLPSVDTGNYPLNTKSEKENLLLFQESASFFPLPSKNKLENTNSSEIRTEEEKKLEKTQEKNSQPYTGKNLAFNQAAERSELFTHASLITMPDLESESQVSPLKKGKKGKKESLEEKIAPRYSYTKIKRLAFRELYPHEWEKQKIRISCPQAKVLENFTQAMNKRGYIEQWLKTGELTFTRKQQTSIFASFYSQLLASALDVNALPSSPNMSSPFYSQKTRENSSPLNISKTASTLNKASLIKTSKNFKAEMMQVDEVHCTHSKQNLTADSTKGKTISKKSCSKHKLANLQFEVMQDKTYQMATEFLLKYRYNLHLQGTQYLAQALVLLSHNEEMPIRLKKGLFLELAKRLCTQVHLIDRAIQYASRLAGLDLSNCKLLKRFRLEFKEMLQEKSNS